MEQDDGGSSKEEKRNFRGGPGDGREKFPRASLCPSRRARLSGKVAAGILASGRLREEMKFFFDPRGRQDTSFLLAFRYDE